MDPDELAPNPRGYAYKALLGSYHRQQSWGWVGLLRSVGAYPTKREFIDNGLDLYDRMVVPYRDRITRQEVQDLMRMIIQELTRTYAEQVKGARYTANKGGYQERLIPRWSRVLSELEPWQQERLGAASDPGVGRVVSDDAAVDLLRQARRLLSPRDVSLLEQYAFTDAESMWEAAEQAGLSRSEYVMAMKNVRKIFEGYEYVGGVLRVRPGRQYRWDGKKYCRVERKREYGSAA